MATLTFRDVHHAVWNALVAAGERECPTRVTRTTRRVRYAPDMAGFRLAYSIDPEFEPRATRGLHYLTIGHANDPVRVLRRYAAILAAAGFAVRVARPRHLRHKQYVWLTTPFDHDDTVALTEE